MPKNIKIETPNGGYAEIIQHSISPEGKEIVTFSLKYGLICHSEFLRHRTLSNSVKSNRAVSMKQIRREVIEDPYVPLKFGKQQSGMVSSEESDYLFAPVSRFIWKQARWLAVGVHWALEKLKLHKEITNRVLNPWQWVRSTTTATEFDNFYNLRLHKDAQKDIYVIAKAMFEAKNISEPMQLGYGEYHVPYVHRRKTGSGLLEYIDNDGTVLTTQEAIEASGARCARSSYDNHDGTKALYHNRANSKGRSDKELFVGLVTSEPKHASCVEHQATPMNEPEQNIYEGKVFIEDGMTHIDTNCEAWSGNLKGWIQYRHLIPNNTCWNFKE